MHQDAEYWNPEFELLDREAIETLQLQRLKETLERCDRSPFYKEWFQKAGFDPASIASLADIARLPLMDKATLRNTDPTSFLTVGMEDIVRMHSSSGTSGQATVIFHTAGDINTWSNMVARCIYMAGVRRSDVFQNMMGYGLFTGGLGLHYAAERIGAMVIPAGSGNSKRQIQLMMEFNTTVIHIIPSYALYLLEVFKEMGVDPRRDTHLRIAVLGAEPHTEGLRSRVQEAYGLEAFNCYGLSEMSGPGVAFECPEKKGLHVWEDYYLLEVVDPVTMQTVEEGEEGELVFTSLCREGMPLLRYRTRDLASTYAGDCACGRSHRRISRIKGRSDDMFIVKGVNIFPMQVEKILLAALGIGSNYRIILDTIESKDEMRVLVEVSGEMWHGEVNELNRLKAGIAEELRREILISPVIELVEPGSLSQTEGKAVRVTDKRNQARRD
ncbi:MAG: phenylacetate--CoA ligase [Candidatus Solincola sediminis]|uniref:Phenylacetate-coenzyme A ligase n=1 Tax=Candidatus Solincola sediminis TaxID=1797199 RepID=A0A1F2WFE4_9ACTN|nr:MAG: phenylacetate--CoA ligase [Candidatus Solincola sediminis]OFW57766.1 MAG: phenylacetate--CoA ligase [Candidatus Solincola sediminis]